MTTRVQKGSTVFRPVAKARSRPAEGTPVHTVIPQDNGASHAPDEAGSTEPSIAPEDAPTTVTPLSTVLPRFSLQGRFDYAVPAAIGNTTKQGVPIVTSSPAPAVQQAKSRPPNAVGEVSKSVDPLRTEASIVEQTIHDPSERGSRSESLATTSPKKNRKVRRLATPAFDTHADPGEDLDPTSVTMAALCEDTGQGRVSSKAAQVLDNHLAWKRSNRDKRARMRIRMEAEKYGGNEDGDTIQASRPEEESEQTPAADATPGLSSAQPVSGDLSGVGDTSGQGFDYSQSVSTSRYNVQVRIGPNGETIVDEESLFVDRNAEEDTTEYIHVEESDVTKFVNSATYSKRFRGSRWSAEETELFYDALSQFGENYELISYILPGRDRKACKNKFKSEDRKNPQRIDYYLKNRKPYDMQTLSLMTGKDFSGPTPEIRAPVVPSLAEPRSNPESDQPLTPMQIADAPSTPTEHVEVVGDVASFDPE